MRKLFFILMMLISLSSFSQSVGYETRTNGKSFLQFNYKQLEFRHKTDNLENRITYRHLIYNSHRLQFTIPLHYKIEKDLFTLEPKLVYKTKKFNVWGEKEFSYNTMYNMAMGIDIPYKNYQYRFGWDDSKAFRFRFLINL